MTYHAVPHVRKEPPANMMEMEARSREAAQHGVDLVLFPETALTGFVQTGQPAHDRDLAVAVPGPETDHLSALARECSVHLAIGLLEAEGARLYDTALLFGPDGRLILKYRRMSSEWHAHDADPAVYRQGVDLSLAHTAFGSVAFLLCGDITYDVLVDQIREKRPDWLLFPIARGFDQDVHDEREWEEQEMGFYGERVMRAGTTTLLVNYVGEMDGCFGGAVAYRPDGSIIAHRPLHQPGLLIVDLSTEAQ